MSWYLIEMPDGALTPYATETESGINHGWGAMPKRKVDLDGLLGIAEELEMDYFDSLGKHRTGTISVEKVLVFEREMAARIRKAVGE